MVALDESTMHVLCMQNSIFSLNSISKSCSFISISLLTDIIEIKCMG